MAGHEPALIPSGRQIEIVHGEQRAMVVEVGGGLRTYRIGGREVLDGYGRRERCTAARGQSLIPWPNRLEDGVYTFDGDEQQLALSEPAKHNAIHGLVRWSNWSVVEHERHRAVMGHRLHPQPGYPFGLDLSIAYSLSPAGLRVTTTATNLGPKPCPYGAGAHPYLTVGTERLDDATLTVPADTWLPTDGRGIPLGEKPVDGTPYDFRAARTIGATQLDTGYTNLLRDEDGLARVQLSLGDGGAAVALWLDRSYPYLMVFTGDSLPEPQRRRRGLGVEAMTCAPNALRSGAGLQILESGSSFTGSWGIEPSPVKPSPVKT